MIAGFAEGKGPQAKECGQPPEVGKGKEMDSPLASRRNTALLMP